MAPLLLVHGAWHGAWCWENFLPYFAEQGYEVHALSLRGHGNSEGREHLRWFSVREYVADLASVASSLGTPPVLIGHSMGGYVVQKYLESHTAPAGVLLTSIPTVGIIGMLLRMLKRHPASTLKALLLMNPWYFVSTPALAKDYLFSDDYPDEKFLEYYPYIQPESFRMALEAAILSLPRPGKIKTPLLVLGAENDRVFSVAEQHKTARAYKTEAVMFPDMAHDMMLEQGWGAVADTILSWLNSRNL
ncbi:MAG TPA: alpha/beta hydrolase [Anaerolineales bacterium]|nr:alpha/beta hydrolase [Anaerolineales bacterium]